MHEPMCFKVVGDVLRLQHPAGMERATVEMVPCECCHVAASTPVPSRPFSEWPTIRPAVSGKGSAGIKMRLWKTRYVMNIGDGGLLRNSSDVLRLSRTARSGRQMAEAAPAV